MIKFILNILIRAIKVGLKYDNNIKTDFLCVPNGFVIKINILPDNIFVMLKFENNKLIKLKDFSQTPDLIIEFKDKKSATNVLLGKTSLADSFCEHRIKVYGNINIAMAITRIVNTVECYLFPKFIYGKLFNPPPQLEVNNAKFYLVLLFGGKLWNILNL